MKAYILDESCSGVGAWKMTTLPNPIPGPGEVLIGVRATSLNYRDLRVAKGSYGKNLKKNCIPLSDGAGEILALGEGVSQFKVGDRVAAGFFQSWKAGEIQASDHSSALGGAQNGMLSEKVVLHSSGIVKIPAHLSYEEAATLPCAALTAWNALMESSGPLKPGSTILTLGTGGVSIFAMQFAKIAGLQVIATSSSDAKLKQLESLGIAHGINYKNTTDWQNEVNAFTQGQGVDQVIEVGGAGTLARSLESVKTGGTVSLIGVLTGTEAQINPWIILKKSIRLQGIFVGSIAMFTAMNRAIESYHIKPIIDEIFSFDKANEALAKLESGSHFGKIVIRM